MNKVVDINKYMVDYKTGEEVEIPAVKLSLSSDSENEEEEVVDFKVSNNPPVDDFNQRKTKKEKKRLINKKLNMLKELDAIKKRKKKFEMSSIIGMKRFEKDEKKFSKVLEAESLKLIQEKKDKLQLIKLGLVEE